MAWKDWAPTVGGVFSAGINYFSQRAANRENVALAQMQNQWNIDQWNRENFYNRPDQQMARLKAAGLNPNLVFANGDMMNEAASSPQMTSGAGMVRPYQIDPLTAAQISNLNAQTRKTDAESRTIDESRAPIVEGLQKSNLKMDQEISESVARVQRYAKENDLDDAKIRDLASQAYKRSFDMMMDANRLENETGLTEAQINLCKAEMNLKKSQKKLTDREFDEMIQTFALRLSGLAQDNMLKSQQWRTAEANLKKLGYEIQILEPDALASGNQSRRLNLFGNTDKSEGYVLGDFLQFLVENTARELGHVVH